MGGAMKQFNDIKMKPKLMGLFLLVGLIPLIIGTWWAVQIASHALVTNSTNQLESVRSIKKRKIELYFSERKGDLDVLIETVSTLRNESMSKLDALATIKGIQVERFFNERQANVASLAADPTVLLAMRELSAVFSDGGFFEGRTKEEYSAPAAYRAVHDRYFPYFKHFMEQYGYYDIFLMTPSEGDVVFTVTKESDFAQRTADVDSSLRDAWRVAANEKRPALSDMRPYEPSANAPALFVA
jgi:methyl-accepting chemotaxis protein